jgi:aspartyl-tRNA(Asn)/glutamyl-tRNA(Gln) amidotransferase subunit B
MAREAVIGLECHVQLRTRSKMFCGCPAGFGAEPNSNVCPVCLGLPGSLPRANRAAVAAGLRLGLALGCEVRAESVFARKNYFYPDMPKNYQITQFDRPLCEGGALPVVTDGVERRWELLRVHLEEDTGKSFHPERAGDRPLTRLDFNRAGVPLLEVVTRPVFPRPADCAGFLGALRRLVRWLGVSDGDMEKGQLRCDANVSLRPAGGAGLGVKTELKNLNSIKGVEKGLAAEIARQEAVLAAGGRIEQATFLYDAEQDRLVLMRSKEEEHDYRYFPDPDLPVLRVDDAWLEGERAALPELPWSRAARLAAQHGLAAREAALLCESRELADYYEALAGLVEPRLACHWVLRDMLGVLRARVWGVAEWSRQVPPGRFADLLGRVAGGEATPAIARTVLEEMVAGGRDPASVLTARGLRVRSSADELRPLVLEVLAEQPAAVEQYLAGRTRVLGFLLGEVMRKSGGQALPAAARRLLEAELLGRAGPGAAGG